MKVTCSSPRWAELSPLCVPSTLQDFPASTDKFGWIPCFFLQLMLGVSAAENRGDMGCESPKPNSRQPSEECRGIGHRSLGPHHRLSCHSPPYDASSVSVFQIMGPFKVGQVLLLIYYLRTPSIHSGVPTTQGNLSRSCHHHGVLFPAHRLLVSRDAFHGRRTAAPV